MTARILRASSSSSRICHSTISVSAEAPRTMRCDAVQPYFWVGGRDSQPSTEDNTTLRVASASGSKECAPCDDDGKTRNLCVCVCAWAFALGGCLSSENVRCTHLCVDVCVAARRARVHLRHAPSRCTSIHTHAHTLIRYIRLALVHTTFKSCRSVQAPAEYTVFRCRDNGYV